MQSPEVEAKCKRLSCVHPKICKLLGTDHGPLVESDESQSREVPGIRQGSMWRRASGWIWPSSSPEYMQRAGCKHHVGGHLKVAPEHTDSETLLRLMKKPDIERFRAASRTAFQEGERRRRANRNSIVVPYFIASHPGSDLHAMIDLALFLKRNGYRPDQVQDFIPAPFDIATCMYHTGIDPFSGEEVFTAKHLRDRKLQRALLQFFKPENYFEVREALMKAGRADLIGSGCDALIPSQPPKAAMKARIEKANHTLTDGNYVHQIEGGSSGKSKTARPAGPGTPSSSVGYRPNRKTAKRRPR